MNNRLVDCRYILIRIVLMLMLIFSGCSTAEPEYVFFKTEIREQLEERAVEYCHGDFKVLQEEEFGPYTRARLQCMQ
ncbi:MAG: hypothetical protein MK368_04045 [SAR324 cluster bacterium]|nr:hypothetical protein [SAR324 cluster bacterium]